MYPRLTLALVLLLATGAIMSPGDAPRVRIWGDQMAESTATPTIPALETQFWSADPAADGLRSIFMYFHNSVLVRYGDNVPGVGPLALNAANSTANVNAYGQAAFYADVQGASRNQGIFVADGLSVTPIVIGCGGGGGSGVPGNGCGDPSPIGGTFSGIFSFTPAFNNAGDVVFLSDINGGSAPRGLFYYSGTTHQITKIVAIGDVSPAGGTISAMGLASMNNYGDVVLLAEHNGTNGPVHVLKWSSGTLTALIKVGDPAPGGGTFSLIGREYFGFADGTRVYSGNVPGINDAGHVAFFSLVNGGIAERGIFLRTGSSTQWYLKAGDATPAGGTYLDFWQPLLANSDVVAIFCDIRLSGSQTTSAWIAGGPNQWRKVLAFYDPLFGGQVWGMAVSRNPVRAVDDFGDLVAWCVIRMPDTSEIDHTLYCGSDPPLIIARKGDATPIGGIYSGMTGWPSMYDHGRGTFGAYTPGSGVPNAFFSFAARFRGDLNCDGVINFDDINPFVLALSDPAGYQATYPNCDINTGDINGDGHVNFDDINPFVTLLSGPN